MCTDTSRYLFFQPDISYVVQSTRAIAEHLHPGMLVVLESTTYPGTTGDHKAAFGAVRLKGWAGYFSSLFPPERVDPGNKLYNTKNTPKIVGGITAACTEVAAVLYESILEGKIHRVSCPAVAEMEKILQILFVILILDWQMKWRFFVIRWGLMYGR